MRTVLLGCPGSGKSTQGKLLSNHFKVPRVSTGEILRDHVRRDTIIGRCVRETLERGLLAPDGLMEDLMSSRLAEPDCDSGYVLDGFPRTVQQAQWLRGLYGHPLAILLDVPQEVAISRIASRGEGRPDDDEAATVIGRIREYERETAPVAAYYEREGMLHRIDGRAAGGDVFDALRRLLESKEQIAYG